MARVRVAATSEPASASVSANAISCRPAARSGSQRSCCSSDAGEDDRQRSELLHGQDQAARGAGATDLLDGEAQRQELPTKPAEALGERQRQDVVRGEERAHVLGKFGGPVDLGGSRRDLLVGQDADGVAQHRLLIGQSVGGAGAVRLGSHHGHRSSAHQRSWQTRPFDMPLQRETGFAGRFCKAYISGPGGESRGA